MDHNKNAGRRQSARQARSSPSAGPRRHGPSPCEDLETRGRYRVEKTADWSGRPARPRGSVRRRVVTSGREGRPRKRAPARPSHYERCFRGPVHKWEDPVLSIRYARRGPAARRKGRRRPRPRPRRAADRWRRAASRRQQRRVGAGTVAVVVLRQNQASVQKAANPLRHRDTHPKFAAGRGGMIRDLPPAAQSFKFRTLKKAVRCKTAGGSVGIVIPLEDREIVAHQLIQPGPEHLGNFQPLNCVNFVICPALNIGMMPGTSGTLTPRLPATWSRKAK